MISWSIFLGTLLGFVLELFGNFERMLIINLPLIGISRALFLLAYYFHFVRRDSNTEDIDTASKRKLLDTWQEVLYFVGKNALIVILGTFSLFLALFFAAYSLMCAAGFLRTRGEVTQTESWEKMGQYLSYLVPFLFSGLGGALAGSIAIVPALLGGVFFLIWGQDYSSLSREGLLERYQNRRLARIPNWIQIFVVLAITVPTTIVVLGLLLSGIPFLEWVYFTGLELFSLNIIITCNLPLTVAGFCLITVALYYERPAGNGSAPTSGESIEDGKNAGRVKKQFILAYLLGIVLSTLLVFVALFFAVLFSVVSISQSMRARKNPSNGRINRNPGVSLITYSILLLITSVLLSFLTLAPLLSAITILLGWMLIGSIAGIIFATVEKRHSGFRFSDWWNSIHTRTRVKPKPFLKFFIILMVFLVPFVFIVGVGAVGYNQDMEDTLMVKMRDGTNIATDIYYSPLAWDYLAGQPEAAPVILVRTPYGKGDMGILYSSLYNSQGYHVVIQDFRGCFESEGGDDFLLFTKDYLDGPDTINWILDQSWCNGLVGSSGISALCITQYMYAPTAPEALKCQALWFGSPDLIQDAILEGAFHEGLVNFWIKGVAPNNYRRQLDIIYDVMEDPARLSEIEARSISLDYPPNQYGSVNVHALHVGGWYDHFLRGSIRGYTSYDDLGGPGARGKQKLIIGPWIHGMVFLQNQGELVYPKSSIGLPLILQWEQEIFDESLKGATKDIWSGDRVAYYLMGDVDDPTVDANKWKFAADWPLNNSFAVWTLGTDAGNNLIITPDAGDLAGVRNISYLYDPINPVMTRGGNNEPSYTEKGSGPFDQRPVEEVNGILRDDVKVFLSEEFTEPVNFEGNLRAKLHIASNCTDTCFVVKFCDVYPDGRRMLIIDSALYTRWRDGIQSMNFLTPGQEYVIEVDLAATAYQFNTGHRLAVTITSSNYDRYSNHPNTDGPITTHYSEANVANNTIVTGPGKSCLFLPVCV